MYVYKYVAFEFSGLNSVLGDVVRKPTTTNINICYKSNHRIEHKLPACRFIIKRTHQLPLSEENKQQKMRTVLQITHSNVYPRSTITQLNKRIEISI